MKQSKWILMSKWPGFSTGWATNSRCRNQIFLMEEVRRLLRRKRKPCLAAFRIDLESGTWEYVNLGPDVPLDLDDLGPVQLRHALVQYLNTRFGFKRPEWHEDCREITWISRDGTQCMDSPKDKLSPGSN
jgi:hypothetical protein